LVPVFFGGHGLLSSRLDEPDPYGYGGFHTGHPGIVIPQYSAGVYELTWIHIPESRVGLTSELGADVMPVPPLLLRDLADEFRLV
jgi:hypothetical protein